MSQSKLLAYGLMLLGVVLGFVIGGRAGVICAVVFLVVGWSLRSFAVTARPAETPDDSKPGAPAPSLATLASRQPIQIRVEIKEAHAYAATKPANSIDKPKWDFDVFVNLSLTTESQESPTVKKCRLKVTMPDGTTKEGEEIRGDLQHWRMEGEGEQEDWDLWDTAVTKGPAPMTGLDLTLPLQCLVGRSGWLHFRVREVSAEEFQQSSLEISVEDFFSGFHVGRVSLVGGSLSYPVTTRKVVPREATGP